METIMQAEEEIRAEKENVRKNKKASKKYDPTFYKK